jgi:geranylgeranyl pyrophosphate synthase
MESDQNVEGSKKPVRDYLSSVNHTIPIELLEPFDYVWDKKGKGIRSTLMSAFNVWLQIPKEKLVEVDHVISMLHNASLMYVPIKSD